MDLLVSRRSFKVYQYFSAELSDMKALGRNVLKVEWLIGLRNTFLPNLIQLVLGRPVEWGGDLIMMTTFWPDQSWFPEIMRLPEPSRRFQSSDWLLWNTDAG